MPELPEVETVRRGLAPAMVGTRLDRVELRRPDLRFPLPDRFAERLAGTTIEGLTRRAKYLLAPLSSGEVLVMHLGMSGRFLVRLPGDDAAVPGRFHHEGGEAMRAHDHVIFHLSTGASVTYNDVRRFGFMDLLPAGEVAASRHFAGLGMEPLGRDLTGAAIRRLFAGRRTPLKAALLDQRLVAGLGNIYVCETLFRAGLDPRAPAGGLTRAAAARLAATIRTVLAEAVEAGGSTLRDHARPDGTLGYFQHSFRVYDREGEACGAPGCGGTVGRLVQAGRSTFYCAQCQAGDTPF